MQSGGCLSAIGFSVRHMLELFRTYHHRNCIPVRDRYWMSLSVWRDHWRAWLLQSQRFDSQTIQREVYAAVGRRQAQTHRISY